jgi:two-component system CheB/CheR fusion protein
MNQPPPKTNIPNDNWDNNARDTNASRSLEISNPVISTVALEGGLSRIDRLLSALSADEQLRVLLTSQLKSSDQRLLVELLSKLISPPLAQKKTGPMSQGICSPFITEQTGRTPGNGKLESLEQSKQPVRKLPSDLSRRQGVHESFAGNIGISISGGESLKASAVPEVTLNQGPASKQSLDQSPENSIPSNPTESMDIASVLTFDFFHTPQALACLVKNVIPELLAQHSNDRPIRIWVANCGSGEEAYSIAMLFIEGVAAANLTTNVKIFASDNDAEAIAIARAGIYPVSVAGSISADRLRRFFRKRDNHHIQVAPELRELVEYFHQKLPDERPFSDLDLICCRNLLIYPEPETQQRVISLLHSGLVEDGYLFLGFPGPDGELKELFDPVSPHFGVYRRVKAEKQDEGGMPSLETHRTSSSLHPGILRNLTEHLISKDYAPAAALINRNLEVLNVTGPWGNYLEIRDGGISWELPVMARPGLRTKLQSACQQAIRKGTTIIVSDAKVWLGERFVPCSIHVRPLPDPAEGEGLMLVVFYHQQEGSDFLDKASTGWTVPRHGDSGWDPGDSARIRENALQLVLELESELQNLSGEINTLVEELENLERELKNRDQEFFSIHRELDSVYRELNQSKNDLRERNGELTTLRGQLETNVLELQNVTDDLTNLMVLTETVMIFLDDRLHLKLFTRPAEAFLNLKVTDIGRPLRDLPSGIANNGMIMDCQEVLRHQIPIEREFVTGESCHILCRILPYRTSAPSRNGTTSGVVITLADGQRRKSPESGQNWNLVPQAREVQEISERFQALLNLSADAIITFTSNGRIENVNPASENLFHYPPSRLVGQNISLLLPGLGLDRDDAKEFSEGLEEFPNLIDKPREMLAKRPDGSTFFVDLAVGKIKQLDVYLAILRDITPQKKLKQHVLEIAFHEQRRIGQELHDGTQQELTVLSLICGMLRELLSSADRYESSKFSGWLFTEKDYQQIQRHAEKLSEALEKTNQHIIQLSRGIIPVQIDAEELQSALGKLAMENKGRAQIKCQFGNAGRIDVGNGDAATQLYRITQESLNNAIKHSQATEITISLSQQIDQIVLEISDNGIGFDQRRTKKTGISENGVGLQIMEYRVNSLGGSLKIKSNPNNGTTVRCIIPKLKGCHEKAVSTSKDHGCG